MARTARFPMFHHLLGYYCPPQWIALSFYLNSWKSCESCNDRQKEIWIPVCSLRQSQVKLVHMTVNKQCILAFQMSRSIICLTNEIRFRMVLCNCLDHNSHSLSKRPLTHICGLWQSICTCTCAVSLWCHVVWLPWKVQRMKIQLCCVRGRKE